MDSFQDALKLSGWQPIDTAPKDGTPVLLYEGGIVGLFYWGFDVGLPRTYRGDRTPDTWVGVIVQSELNRSDIKDKLLHMHGSEATHWMPLPAPPEGG